MKKGQKKFNKKEFDRIAKLLSISYSMPTEDDIEEAISIIEEKLSVKAINKFENAAVREGYAKSLIILKERIKDVDNAGIEYMNYLQAKAIAAITVDYLNGKCSQAVLCEIPIKGGPKKSYVKTKNT